MVSAAEGVDLLDDVAEVVVLVGRRIAQRVVTVSIELVGVVGADLDRVAGGVDERDQPALGVVLGPHAGAAERVVDLGQEVRPARCVIDERRRVAVAVGHGHEVALGVVRVVDRISRGIGGRRRSGPGVARRR